jgi:RND family efflux transporter MFP subunit
MSEREVQNQPQHGSAEKKGHLFLMLIVVALALVVLGALTLLQRRSQYRALADETETLAVPTVSVTHATTEASQEDLVLPGAMQSYVESPIYARTNGYLKAWYHDIGSHVSKGELLADIDTPEVDQQLAQSKADLNTAHANTDLSRTTSSRYVDLLKTDSVSQQEVDNFTSDFAAKTAIENSSQANVRRLEDLESFKRVYAPFNGVITKRNVDIGNLINAGNTGATQLLFVLSQIDPIRVYVNVPEAYAPAIHTGLGAYLVLTQFPGRRFEGRVVRTANAIDPGTRTLLTEVDVPNKSGELLPGGYSEVHLEVKVTGARLQVPVNALLFRSEGLRAVIVDADHKTHLRPLQIGRDYGTTLEVLQGLDPNDWIVVNPADSLDEGQQVNVKELPHIDKPVPAGIAPPPTIVTAPTPTGNNNGNHGAGNHGGASNGKGAKNKSQSGSSEK